MGHKRHQDDELGEADGGRVHRHRILIPFEERRHLQQASTAFVVEVNGPELRLGAQRYAGVASWCCLKHVDWSGGGVGVMVKVLSQHRLTQLNCRTFRKQSDAGTKYQANRNILDHGLIGLEQSHEKHRIQVPLDPWLTLFTNVPFQK